MKYKLPESTKKDLLRMVRVLLKRNTELVRELHPYREFKKAILADKEKP
jgi:hypothetical protein